jgi:hypothetical protein
LRKEYRLRVFENRVLRRMNLDPKGRKTDHGENCIMVNFITVFLTEYFLGDKIKEDEVGGTCGMHGGEEMCLRCSSCEARG